jgi:uncharacterized protein YjbJ (UPF0337 family)
MARIGPGGRRGDAAVKDGVQDAFEADRQQPVRFSGPREILMNEDTLKGQWKQLQGKARQQWGKLTDDDLTQIKGDRDVLLGKIQEHYGRTRDEAMKDVDKWLQGEGIR